MRRLFRWIVDHPRLLLTVFLTLTLLSALLRGMVGVNYDMKAYLPADAPSTAALELMQTEFPGGIPNVRVMLRDVSIPEALAYKEKLRAIPGVTAVTWLDDAADIRVPLAMIDPDVLRSYYQDGNALLTLTVEKDSLLTAVDSVRGVIGEGNAMAGEGVVTAVATDSTVSEIRLITVGAVLFVILVLILTTPSWFEPVLILSGLGVAILINAGTNLVFGEISFVTNAAGMILQLAVSLDYSVFLLHRFEECRREFPDIREAMTEALCRSASSVLSSGLTTVIGFAALVFMRFGIGPDLGLALAKGVAISLLTVFAFVPPLTVALQKPLDRLHHRPFLPSFKGFGRVVSHVMLPLAALFALVIVPSFLASGANTFYYGATHIFGTDTKLGADTAAIEEAFGKSDTYVLMVPRGDPVSEAALSASLRELPEVRSVLSYTDTVGAEIPTSYLESGTLALLESEHCRRLVISVSAESEGEEAFRLVEAVRALGEQYYPGGAHLAGGGVSTYDLMDTITADNLKVNLIAVGAIFVILLLMMRSLTLPVLLVCSIETAIWLNLAVPFFTDTPVFYISYLIISSVQLGATVDYAILLTDRYREFRRTLPRREAVAETVSTVTVSILTSGSAMAVVGFLLGGISTHGILSQLGFLIGRGALLSMGIVLFVLPGLLFLFDRIVCRRGHKPEKEVTLP